ncbi:MAG TPA: helix-hairpin-helix domain-containing protein [Chitinophagaceae bacterium]|nr:helix-hairpin-helix domain-containing protein [Chitinophagaceae bacterium]
MWKYFLKEYLSFTKKERTGTFILLAIILICIFLPFVYPYFIHHKPIDHAQFDKEIAQLKIQQVDSSTDKKYNSKNFDENNYPNYYEPSEKNYYSKAKGEVFYFDPNTATVNDWQRLGVREKTAETIQKYLSKGGHFYKPEDIAKIWGLHKDDIERLLPYVRIESTQKQYTNDYKNFGAKPEYNNTSYKKPIVPNVEINFADTTAFIALPGIGSRLAQRIISFRDKLGGFYSIDQIRETYGLPDSTFIKIKPKLNLTNVSVKKININTATPDEMKSHPYIRYNIANAIVQYRKQHGNFSAVEDIKKIMIITDEIFNKASPYLTIN